MYLSITIVEELHFDNYTIYLNVLILSIGKIIFLPLNVQTLSKLWKLRFRLVSYTF